MQIDEARDDHGRFAKNCTPGPGRPRGTGKNQRLLALLAEHGDEIMQVVIDGAKAGDTAMLKMCLDRMLPTLKAVEHTQTGTPLAPKLDLYLSVGDSAAQLVEDEVLAKARAGEPEALQELGRRLLRAAPSMPAAQPEMDTVTA